MEWMTDLYNNVANFPDRCLSEITIPGTHDAGCYIDHNSIFTSFIDSMSRTQTHNVAQQLDGGIRYFDIRPAVYSSTEFWTYHGKFALGYWGDRIDGATGILAQVSNYLDNLAPGSRELIILNIAHFYKFSNENHERLVRLIGEMLASHLVPHTQQKVGLFSVPIRTLLTDAHGAVKPRVAIIYDGALDEDIEDYILENDLPEGFFKVSPKYEDENIPPGNKVFLFDQYSNTADMNDLQDNQLEKLDDRTDFRFTTKSWGNKDGNWYADALGYAGSANTMHVLSWTLTPQPWGTPINAATNQANPALEAFFTGNNWGGAPYSPVTQKKVNIIYVDMYQSQLLVSAVGSIRNGWPVPVALADYLNRYTFNAARQPQWAGWGNL